MHVSFSLRECSNESYVIHRSAIPLKYFDTIKFCRGVSSI